MEERQYTILNGDGGDAKAAAATFEEPKAGRTASKTGPLTEINEKLDLIMKALGINTSTEAEK